MKRTDTPIVVEQVFKTSINKLWNAVSNLDEMKAWYFDNIDAFKPELGIRSEFAVSVEDRVFTHLWEVTEVVPLQKLTYNWKYKEYPGDSFVTFELFEEGNLVKLKLQVDVVEDFPDDVPEFTRESCVQGWNYFIGQRLKNYLDKHS